MFAALFGVFFIITSVMPALAEESDTDEFILEEITVTAQKREENQQKVPIAMEVISGDDIKELGKNSVDTILNNLASVMINTGVDGYRVSIRGMSNDNAAFKGVVQASTPTVAINTDGAYTNRNSAGSGLYDVESVEVLYGPQSTLYASASPGGIVNIQTTNPKVEKYEVSASVEYGSYNLLRTQGSVNVPLGDSFALRGAFSTSKHDGYLSNGASDEDTKSARLKALYQPGDRFSIVITGELSDTGGQGFSGVTAFDDESDVSDPWTSDSDVGGLESNQENQKITANINMDFGYAGSLTLIPTYSETDNDREGIAAGDAPPGFEASSSMQKNTSRQDEKGIEARISSSADFPFTWLIGGNIYESTDEETRLSYDLDSDNNLEDDVADSINYTTNDQNTKAIYGNVTYPVTDTFRTTLGARQTWDENASYNYEWPSGPTGDTKEQSPAPQEYSNPNYKLGVEYDLADNAMLYADVSTSYRTQGMSFGNDDSETFPPEELTAYTLGTKNRFLNNRLQVNASAYYYDYTNYLAAGDPHQIIIDANENGVVDDDEGDDQDEWTEETAKEVGDVVIWGVDLQTSTMITSNDRFDLSVSYIEKYFKSLVFDWSDFTNEAMGLPDVDYSDQQMPNAPKWSVTASHNHNFNLWNGGRITTKLELRYQSSYVLNWQAYQITQLDEPVDGQYFVITDTENTRYQEDYHIENISIVYAHPGNTWTLSAYCNNVMNYAVKRSYMQGDLMLGDPRVIGAVLSVKF
jgi:iron complex outermembrane receptor protein